MPEEPPKVKESGRRTSRENCDVTRCTIVRAIGAALIMTSTMGVTANAEQAWPPRQFPIGFWCGPPEKYITVDQYKLIAKAGFTFVSPPCEGEATVERNRKILDTAKAAGIKALISDSRLPLSITGNTHAAADLKAIVADYKKHPALLGYFITDEPGANAFPGLAEVVAELHRLDPEHVAYINLFPNYATGDLAATPSQLNTDTYDNYLDKFLKVVKPDVLSWDHYALLANGERPGFFSNLASVQRTVSAVEPRMPFWQIVLSVKHGPYRALNENELRFQAMQTLVYGASGLMFFTYWLPPNDPSFSWSDGIMNRDGTPGALYDPVTKVNHEVADLAKWLYGARCLRTFQTGKLPPDGTPAPNDLPIKAMGDGDLSIGAFRNGKGDFMALITNRDFTHGVKATVVADAGKRDIELLDPKAGQWKKIVGQTDADDVTTLSLDLGPAGAALIRWQ